LTRETVRKLRHEPEKQIALPLPAPLSGRLDALLGLAEEANEPTSRKELVAALLLAAPEEGESLRELLRSFRTAAVDESFVPGFDASFFLEPYRNQGRRPEALLRAFEARDAATPPLEQPAGEQGQTESRLSVARLVKAPATRVGLGLPKPLDQRLDALVRLADDAGERTTRKELIAALVFGAPDSPQGVTERLRAYRGASSSKAELKRLSRSEKAEKSARRAHRAKVHRRNALRRRRE
jgi:hypothetical protein